MNITREMIIKRLSEKSGYWQKDIRVLLKCLDDVVFECFNEVTDNEEVAIQLVEGIKCGCKVIKSRERVDPRDQKPIIVPDTIKPFAKFSINFRKNIQEQYESKKDG
jgi:hypothetical protein